MSQAWRWAVAESAAETAVVVVAVAALGRVVTARERRGHPSPEHGINHWLAEHRTRPLDTVTWLFSTYADTAATITAALAYGAALGLRPAGQPTDHDPPGTTSAERLEEPTHTGRASRDEAVRRAVAPLAAITLETIAFTSAAALVGRARPAVPQLDKPAPTSSFPSGHTGANVALHMTLARLALPRRSRVRRAMLSTALPTAVAASRVYRGMHHPSDVVVGAAVGAWAARRVRLLEQTWASSSR